MILSELQEEFVRTGELRSFGAFEVIQFKCFECGQMREESVSAKELKKRMYSGKMKVCKSCKENQFSKNPKNKNKLDEVLEKLENIEKIQVEILDKLNIKLHYDNDTQSYTTWRNIG